MCSVGQGLHEREAITKVKPLGFLLGAYSFNNFTYLYSLRLLWPSLASQLGPSLGSTYQTYPISIRLCTSSQALGTLPYLKNNLV
jgi:hypothetical protein